MSSYIVGATAFFIGFTIMSVELICGKLLTPYFGASIYVWGSVIFTFMLSLAIGYLLGGKISLYNPSLIKLGAIVFCGGLALLPITQSTKILDLFYFNDPRYGSLVMSFILFSLPTCLMGIVSPYCIRLLISTKSSVGMTAGKLYFLSTLGSAVGTIGTAFYLVLWIELDKIILLLSGCTLTSGLIIVMLSKIID
ncbi:MAG: fused MFS/spermidine synthase [Pseudomonadota bacterium]